MSWRRTRLGELLRIEHGYAFKGEFFSDRGKYIVLTPGNFHEQGGFRPRPGKDRYYSGPFPERYVLRKDDMIVAMTEQGEGLLGSAAIIPDGDLYLHNQRLGRVWERSGVADRRFLYYLFNSDYVRQQIRNSSSGAKVRHTSPERMYGVNVVVPDSLDVQRKIAAILSAYDDLIANNQRRIALLESMAEEIYREWFVRMRYPGHQQSKSVKGLPQSWHVVELREIAEVNALSVDRRRAPEWIEYVDISSVSPNRIEHSQRMRYVEAPGRARRLVRHGDVIWSAVRSGNRGYCLVLNPSPSLVVSTGFAVISSRDPLPYTYLHRAVTTDSFVDQMVAVAKGSAYPATSFEDFERAKILLPPRTLLDRYHQACEPLLIASDLLSRQSTVLSKVRNSLLPRLISGKLKVDDLDIRFPPAMREEAEPTPA